MLLTQKYLKIKKIASKTPRRSCSRLRSSTSDFCLLTSDFPPGRSGMTFLEVMLVVLVLGLVFAVAMPNMRPTSETQKLNFAARRLVAMCRFARSQAVASGENVYLDFDLINRTIVYGREKDEEEAKRERYSSSARKVRWREGERPDPGDDEELGRFQLPENVRVAEMRTYEELFFDGGEKARLYFYRDGKASRATIILVGERPARDGSGDTRVTYYTVEVYHATGMVSSTRGYPENEKPADLNAPALAGRRREGENFAYLFQPLDENEKKSEKTRSPRDRDRNRERNSSRNRDRESRASRSERGGR
jgi:type II secretion system protein H